MTKARQAVLKILSDAQEPLSATAILNILGDCCDQATVYRTLHYLEEQGYADSFILHCREHGTERYYTAAAETSNTAHHHWFHCEACHHFIPIGPCTVESLAAAFEAEQCVQVRTHVLYFTGLCQRCLNNSQHI